MDQQQMRISQSDWWIILDGTRLGIGIYIGDVTSLEKFCASTEHRELPGFVPADKVTPALTSLDAIVEFTNVQNKVYELYEIDRDRHGGIMLRRLI